MGIPLVDLEAQNRSIQEPQEAAALRALRSGRYGLGPADVDAFKRPRRQEDRQQIEVEQVGDLRRQVEDTHPLFVRSHFDHLAANARIDTQASQRRHHVGNDAEAAGLPAVGADDRLLAAEHPVDHDAGDVAIRTVVALARADDVVRDGDIQVRAGMPLIMGRRTLTGWK
jgi:hypothetical protein